MSAVKWGTLDGTLFFYSTGHSRTSATCSGELEVSRLHYRPPVAFSLGPR